MSFLMLTNCVVCCTPLSHSVRFHRFSFLPCPRCLSRFLNLYSIHLSLYLSISLFVHPLVPFILLVRFTTCRPLFIFALSLGRTIASNYQTQKWHFRFASHTLCTHALLTDASPFGKCHHSFRFIFIHRNKRFSTS